MADDISCFSRPVTLLGGGESSTATVNEALRRAPELVATDGAAAVALEMGHMPRLVVGDMDSLMPEDRARLPEDRIREIAEQDSTDFDKALRTISAPFILGVGFMGARLDHELACLAGLVRRVDRRCILVGEHDICFAVEGVTELTLPPGTRLSLFPMARVVVSASGLVWPVEALEMSPWGQIGTSNEVTGPVRLSTDGPGLLVVLPRAGLPAAIETIAAPES